MIAGVPSGSLLKAKAGGSGNAVHKVWSLCKMSVFCNNVSDIIGHVALLCGKIDSGGLLLGSGSWI